MTKTKIFQSKELLFLGLESDRLVATNHWYDYIDSCLYTTFGDITCIEVFTYDDKTYESDSKYFYEVDGVYYEKDDKQLAKILYNKYLKSF